MIRNTPMTRAQILARFPNASAAVLGLAADAALAGLPSGPVLPETPRAETRRAARRREPNKTERDFLRYLEAMQRRGEIVSVEFEGMMLRWPDGMRYSPDFFVVVSLEPLVIRFYEIKGGFCWQKDLVKFRAAKDRWRMFRFEFWEKQDGVWRNTI